MKWARPRRLRPPKLRWPVPERVKPHIYNIAAHGGFADALAQGLIDRFDDQAFGLARLLIILPNNRARKAVQDAFVRLSEEGLLLPQMAVIGDLDLDESVGVALDSGELALDIAPAIEPLDRLLMLAQLIDQQSKARGDQVLAKDALRLAREFARTLDQLAVEEIDVRELLDLEVEPHLSDHWQNSLSFFRAVAEKWQKQLQEMGYSEQANRRNRLFDCLSHIWSSAPPERTIVAAGITTAAPAIARFLRTIAFLPRGMVVLPDLDLVMPDEEWALLDSADSSQEGFRVRRAQETHPQFHLKILLERMSFARVEVMRWPRTGDSGAIARRSKALSHAFAIPELTSRWSDLPASERSLAGVQTVEAKTSGEEAQIVALLAREALEQPRRRIAIVTPDRSLAARISSHLRRWDIRADDTAGQPLSKLPEGILFLNLLAVVAEDFAPAALLALLKHPLVHSGENRLDWLENVRNLDLLLRGPRPAPGLNGIDNLLKSDDRRTRVLREEVSGWWSEIRPIFENLSVMLQPPLDWKNLLVEIRSVAGLLTGDQLWKGPGGRALADFLSELQVRETLGPGNIQAAEIGEYFETFLSEIAVRTPYGGHPRIAIFGLLEARLQQADLAICCGLNEGSWPQKISPDPWLAPMVRKSLGLPEQERQIGLSAHDLVGIMGSKDVILTRALRDDNGPALASRFLLRLQAMCGTGLRTHSDARRLGQMIDWPEKRIKLARPAPDPKLEQRNVPFAVTQADRLKADPFAFYANKIMNLSALEKVDAEPGAAWRGTVIHRILEDWAKQDRYDPDRLIQRAERFLNDRNSHPLMRSLWAPRLMEGLRWIAATVSENLKSGRVPVLSEQYGVSEIAGVELSGIPDRIDRLPDGSLAIVDYKTGGPPSNRAVREGFNLQLGLLGALAEQGLSARFPARSPLSNIGRLPRRMICSAMSSHQPGDRVTILSLRMRWSIVQSRSLMTLWIAMSGGPNR